MGPGTQVYGHKEIRARWVKESFTAPGIAAVIAMIPLGIWIQAYTLMLAWKWFLIPTFSTLPELSLRVAIGFVVFKNFCIVGGHISDEDFLREPLWKTCVGKITESAFSLGFVALVHLLIGG